MTDAEHTTLSSLIQAHYKNAGAKPGKAKPHRPQKPCQYEDCTGWAWAQGYCDPHYQKLKSQGVLKNVRIVGDLNARFDASYEVNPVTGCWEWTGWIHPKGYGILSVGGACKKVRAHRYSYERFVGPIPKGVMALHKCHNRKCCNWEHIYLGDNAKNMQDCVAMGRHGSKKGVSTVKLSPAMAMNIRIMYARGQHSMQNLADIYGVQQGTISDVLKGRSHQGVG